MPNMDCVANISLFLAHKKIPTLHLISVGGWNAPHPDTELGAREVWAAWKEWNSGHVARASIGFNGFDGIDWDLEGNDDKRDPGNVFSVDTLDLMGRVSQLAKQDGFLVGIAPAESYLDVTTPAFDLSLLHTHPEWEGVVEFGYHGRNCYAYVLAHYDQTQAGAGTIPTFDFVSVQLYESYSHANYAITQVRACVCVRACARVRASD